MSQGIEPSAAPNLDARGLAMLSSLWVSIRRAEQASLFSERDALLKIFDRTCRTRKLHVPTVSALFQHWLPQP